MQKDEIDINTKSFALKAKSRFTLKELSKIFEKISNKKLNINWGGKKYRNREVLIPWKNGEEIPGYVEKVSIEEGIRMFINE